MRALGPPLEQGRPSQQWLTFERRRWCFSIPLGIAPLNLIRFVLWGLPVMAGALAPRPMRRWLGRRLWNPLLEDKLASRLLLRGMITHVPGYPLFKPLPDDELLAVNSPVTLVLAEQSEPFDPDAVVRRARAHINDVQMELIAAAGHALTVSHSERCVDAIERAVAHP